MCGNTGSPMDRWILVRLNLDASEALIKYFRSSVAEIWDSINIFVKIIKVLITIMADLVVL